MFTERPEWTCDLVSQMHKYAVTKAELAKETNLTRPYLSMILAGKIEPPHCRDYLPVALNRIIEKRLSE